MTRLASLGELSRPTVRSHIDAIATTHALHLIRPYHGGGKREIVARPKCYGFDTGFVCFEKGWTGLRPDDRGVPWEHLVLDTLRGLFRDEALFYWQDKSGREVEFVIRRDRGPVDVLECTINPDHFNPSAVQSFRQVYPQCRNFIVSPAARRHYRIRLRDLAFTVCDTSDLATLTARSESVLDTAGLVG